MLKIKSTQFISSNTSLAKCPQPTLPEFAFIGRSNVGKSSLINLLVGQKKLAKVSHTPGKTQAINHFLINDSWYLVDLPGFGYAKLSKKTKASISKMAQNYLLKRTSLVCVMMLVDIRRDPLESDLEIINFLGESGIPFALVYTKADKVSKNQSHQQIGKMKKALSETWEEFPPMFLTSAFSRDGKDEVLDFIGKSLENLREK